MNGTLSNAEKEAFAKKFVPSWERPDVRFGAPLPDTPVRRSNPPSGGAIRVSHGPVPLVAKAPPVVHEPSIIVEDKGSPASSPPPPHVGSLIPVALPARAAERTVIVRPAARNSTRELLPRRSRLPLYLAGGGIAALVVVGAGGYFANRGGTPEVLPPAAAVAPPRLEESPVPPPPEPSELPAARATAKERPRPTAAVERTTKDGPKPRETTKLEPRVETKPEAKVEAPKREVKREPAPQNGNIVRDVPF